MPDAGNTAVSQWNANGPRDIGERDLQGERVNATGPREPANADRAVHLSPPPGGRA